MSEELSNPMISIVGRIVMLVIGVAGLLAFSNSGENYYQFEIGTNLLIFAISGLLLILILKILDVLIVSKSFSK